MAGVQQAQWSRYLDEKSGKYYFYNKATRKTVWRRPKGFRRSGSAVSSSSSRNTPRKAQPLRSATGGIEPSLGTGRDSDFAVEGLTRRGSKFNMANPLTAGKATDASTGSSLEMVNRASPSKDQSEGKTLTVAGVSHSVEERGNGTAKKSTSAWKGGRGAGTAVKKAKRAMRRLQMMQKLKKQKESVRLNVLDTMDAIGFTARNFKHRARDIVNIANMAFLVVALGAIISVSYSSGRKSIDTSLSYLGIDQVERVQTKFSTMLDHTKGTINMLSYMTSRRSFLADALDDRTSALLYGALLSNPQFAHFEVDGLGAMRGDFTKVTDNARRTIYVWSTFANGSRAVRKSVDQGSTFTGAVIAEKGETLETSLFDMFPSCAGRGVTAENKSCVFSSLQGQPSNINKIRHTRLLHCCGLGDAGTTSVSLTIDTLGLNQTIVVDDAVQIANKFQETHADKSFRIVLYDESLGIVARSFNETGQTDAWCDGGIHDQFLRECYRRIYSFYGRICKLRLKSGAQQQCSESAVIAKDLMKGPLNGCLRASLESDQEQHIFKSRLGDSGVQLKLTYGQDSKLEAYRIFLDSIHPDVSGGLAVAFSEVAFQASFGHGMLVTIPVVSAFLLLMSFGCSHLSLSLLGYDAKSLKGVRLGADTQPQSSSLQYMRHALQIITTVASSAKSLVARWWLLLIIFSTIIAVINAHIMGRGWGISMLTCKRDVSWRAYQGATRALSTIFRVPVAWACWTQMWTSRCLEEIPTGTRGRCTYWCRQNHKTHQMSKRYWVGLIAATSIATVCEFFFGYLLDDDGVGYEQHGIGIYLLLEILTVLSYFAVLPFVCRRRYSTKRKTDIELVDGDVTLEHSNDRGSVSSVSSVGSLGELVAESAGRDDGNKTDEISLGVQSSTEYSGRRVRSASVTSKNLDYIEGWGFWSTAGVTVAIFMGIHVVVTALIEASSLTAKAGDLHALNPPQLTTSEVSRVLEVLWFAPLLVCMLLSMRQMPDAHSHTAFGLLSGFFSCLFPFILGRSFLFFLVWFKSDINGWFQCELFFV